MKGSQLKLTQIQDPAYMRKTLSDLFLKSAKPGVYWDEPTDGLHIRVGTRKSTWQLRFMHEGSYRFERLGHYPKLGLKEARGMAEEIAERVRTGAPVTAQAKPE